MSLIEIIALARRMVRELKDGLRRACSYLKGLGLPAEFAAWALLRG
jgi:hypothetical protein